MFQTSESKLSSSSLGSTKSIRRKVSGWESGRTGAGEDRTKGRKSCDDWTGDDVGRDSSESDNSRNDGSHGDVKRCFVCQEKTPNHRFFVAIRDLRASIVRGKILFAPSAIVTWAASLSLSYARLRWDSLPVQSLFSIPIPLLPLPIVVLPGFLLLCWYKSTAILTITKSIRFAPLFLMEYFINMHERSTGQRWFTITNGFTTRPARITIPSGWKMS